MKRKFKTRLLPAGVLIISAISIAIGQGGDPRNPKPSSTPTNSSPASGAKASRKPMTKADLVKARLIELFDLCKADRYTEANSYIERKNAESICQEIKAKIKDGYYFGKFIREKYDDGTEALGWEVFYRGATEPKSQGWGFKLLNGKYVLLQ